MSGDLRLGDWIIRPQRRTIERGDESVQVKPKSMAVFECLAAAKGEPVSRKELLEAVWPGAEVSDDVLTKCIVELRRGFGDSARASRVIETIPKFGFRLVLPAEPLEENPPGGEPSSKQDYPHRRGQRRGLKFAGLVFLAVVLLFGSLLSFSASRSRLIETGMTLFLKTAAFITRHSIEQRTGIAVLPFMNFSGDPENEYFSDGLSVELINTLARANRLPVIARSSSFEFKNRQQDVREIGRRLGVTHVLEGSVRRADERVRLTVQLIDATTGGHVWSGVYQRDLGDIFDLQQEIATQIVDQIYLTIGGRVAPAPGGVPPMGFVKTQPPSNLEAYDLFLKGLEMVASNRPALVEQAPAVFDRAIALDPDYADAWAGKGYALGIMGWSGSGTSIIPASVYPEAIAALRQALEIEPEHAFATGWLGSLLMVNDFKWAEGMRLLEQAIEWNPNNAELLAVYGFYLDTFQMAGASEVLERAYRLDPFNLQTTLNLAIHLQRQGRLLDAAALAETTLVRDREGYAPNYFSALFNLRIGRLDAAEAQIRRARRVAKPVDLKLDVLQSMIDSRRRGTPLPVAEIWKRMQTEPLQGAVQWDGFRDEKILEEYGIEKSQIVAVFELAIEQRHHPLRSALFLQEPPLMPEAEWRRFKEITGATQFQESLRE